MSRPIPFWADQEACNGSRQTNAQTANGSTGSNVILHAPGDEIVIATTLERTYIFLLFPCLR